MVSPKKPDYTFGELEGIDALTSLGIEIQDDAPAEQEQPGRDRFPGNGQGDVPARDPDKARKLRETLARWQTQQENELVEVNPDAVERDRAVAAEHAPELVAEYDAVMVRNENIPGRINERLAGLSKGLPEAKLGEYGTRAVWWAQVDPLTRRWIVPAKEEHGVAAGDLVVGEFNGVLRAGVVDKPEDIPGGMLLDAGSDQGVGNSVGHVLQRFDKPYRELTRRHESGDLRREWEAKEAVSGHGLPERSAAPAASESMTETVSHESAEIAQATVRDPDTGETVTLTAAKEGDGPTVVTAKSEGEAGPLLAATEAAMQDVAQQGGQTPVQTEPAPTVQVDVIESPGARTARKKERWNRIAEEHGLTGFKGRSDEELEAAIASAQAEIDAGQYDTGDPGDRIALLGYINTARHTLNTRDKTKPEYTAEPPAPEPASAESPATEGQGFEPLPEGYDLSAYGFGDSDAGPEAAGDAPEPAPEPDKYELANQHGAMLAEQSGLERDSDEWMSVSSEGYNAYLDDLEGITGPKMTWTKRLIVPTESGYAVVEPAPVESPATEGQGFEPLPEGYDLSAYGFGDPDVAPEATSASENDNRYLDENGEIPADKQERLVELIAEHGLGQMSELPDDALLDAMRSAQSAKDSKDTSVEDRRLLSDLINTATMVWRERRGSEQTQGATEPEDVATVAVDAEEADGDEETAALAQRLRGNVLTDSDLSDAELVARHRASQQELEDDERRGQEKTEDRNRQFEQATAYIRDREPELLGNRGKARIWGGVQHSGKIAVPEGTDVQPGDFVIARDMQAGDSRNEVYKLTSPKGLGYAVYGNITSQTTGGSLLEKHGSAYVEWHSPSETADAPSPDIEPTSVDESASEPDDASPVSLPAEASEPEPEAPPLAPVLADAEPGPAEPPPVITPTIGKGPPEPPKVASVSRNDTADQLQQKWKQADQSIDAYAKSYGIAGIPDDAARLVLRPDGSVGVERLRVTPQGSAYRTPARPASGSGGGDGAGGGSSSSKPSAPAIGLRKSWERMSLAEKQSVIDVINDALARRALLSSALVTMTCSPTGDLSLSQGQKMATIVGSCVPRSAPVSPRQSLQAHPWLSKHEMATLGGGQRKSSQSQKGKKSSSRR